MKINVKIASKASKVLFDNIIILANNKAALANEILNPSFMELLNISDLKDQNLIKASAAIFTGDGDKAKSTELLLLKDDGSSTRRVVIAVLPNTASRGNTPSRSYEVQSLVKGKKGSGSLSIHLCGLSNLNTETAQEFAYAQAISIGRCFPNYSLKSGQKDVTNDEVDIVIHFDNIDCNEIDNTIDGIRLAQRLVDTPPNILHTDAYVEEATQVASSIGCKIKVIKGEELDILGFGGLWGVGKASEHLPALVILSHIPENSSEKKSICLVGKGIVYDTGGLSIKVPPGMAGMKTDMGGSAAVLGGFLTIVRDNKVTRPVHALLCISENSVGPLSTRPDDVHKLLSGKTVEVNNTDAEGRLVLSDGVFYASRELNPEYIIDIATLTGAQLIATGKNHAALYCNDDELERIAVSTGKETGDLTHPMPYAPEFYKPEFSSAVADMKNSVKDRTNAQVSCAGQFIGNHLEKYLNNNGKWLHVDMAGPVEKAGRATGFGVALLFKLTKNLN